MSVSDRSRHVNACVWALRPLFDESEEFMYLPVASPQPVEAEMLKRLEKRQAAACEAQRQRERLPTTVESGVREGRCNGGEQCIIGECRFSDVGTLG